MDSNDLPDRPPSRLPAHGSPQQRRVWEGDEDLYDLYEDPSVFLPPVLERQTASTWQPTFSAVMAARNGPRNLANFGSLDVRLLPFNGRGAELEAHFGDIGAWLDDKDEARPVHTWPQVYRQLLYKTNKSNLERFKLFLYLWLNGMEAVKVGDVILTTTAAPDAHAYRHVRQMIRDAANGVYRNAYTVEFEQTVGYRRRFN